MKHSKKRTRNLGVVTIALTFVAMSVVAIWVLWPVTLENMGFVIFATLVGVLALIVAMIGRVDTLRSFVAGFFNSI